MSSPGGIWACAGNQAPAGDAALPELTFNPASPEFFETAGISLLRGRAFSPDDRLDAEPVAVISESARLLFGGSDPIGNTPLTLTPWPKVSRRVVGIVRDVPYGSVAAGLSPALYVPSAQLPWHRFSVVVRTAADPELITSTVRRTLAAVDSELPLKVSVLRSVMVEGITGRSSR